jgi:hypothetical protein
MSLIIETDIKDILNRIEQRFDKIDQRFDKIDQRLEVIQIKIVCANDNIGI